MFRQLLVTLGVLPVLQEDLDIDPIASPTMGPGLGLQSRDEDPKNRSNPNAVPGPPPKPEEDLLLIFLEDDYNSLESRREKLLEDQRRSAAFSAEESDLMHLFRSPLVVGGSVSDADTGVVSPSGYSNEKGAAVAREKHSGEFLHGASPGTDQRPTAHLYRQQWGGGDARSRHACR